MQAVGLPFNYTENGLVSNTFDGHRVLCEAYAHGGSVAQDKAAEVLFHGFHAEEKAPNDPSVLRAACEAAGINGEALVQDKTVGAAAVRNELEIGRRHGITGVPHFLISKEGSSRKEQLSGAQDPEQI